MAEDEDRQLATSFLEDYERIKNKMGALCEGLKRRYTGRSVWWYHGDQRRSGTVLRYQGSRLDLGDFIVRSDQSGKEVHVSAFRVIRAMGEGRA